MKRETIKRGILKGRMPGRTHMLLASVLFLFAALLLFLYSNQKNMVRVVSEYMDDGLTTALMAGGVINMEEHARSSQIIVHNSLPDEMFQREEEGIGGGRGTGEEGEEEEGEKPPEAEKPPVEIPIIDAPGIGEADAAIRRSYEIFKSALQTNLRLDGTFHSKLPVIVSNIEITEYAVYNVFRNIDSDGNFTGKSRICKYQFRNGNWITSTLGEAGSVSIDVTRLAGGNTLRVNNSLIYAEITFDVKILPTGSLFTPPDFDQEDNVMTIHYKRAVDVTVKYQ